MRKIRYLVLLFALLPSRKAAAYMVIDMGDAPPAHTCQIHGDHVSGVVSVDLQNGTRARIPLVDVDATVRMEANVDDVTVDVASPLRFSGTFVSRALGGPAAYLGIGFRSADRHVRVSQDVPFEIALAPSGRDVLARVPTTHGSGALEVTIPCSALTAGAPRARMTVPRESSTAGKRLIAMAVGTIISPTSALDGAPIARVTSMTAGAVYLLGRIRSTEGGAARIAITDGPIRIEGFVPSASVEDATGAIAPLPYAAGPGFAMHSVARRIARLAVATPVFADATTTRPWATVAEPVEVFVRPAEPSGRSMFIMMGAHVGQPACRFDGVADRIACSTEGDLPRIDLHVCDGPTCTDVGYATVP